MPRVQVSEMAHNTNKMGLWLTLLLGLMLVIGFGLMLYDVLLGS